jgi:Domain of unknown function (DUF4386)
MAGIFCTPSTSLKELFMNDQKMAFAGGVAFIVGALAFVAVFSYLAAQFNYPAVLEGSADEVLPRLRAGGSMMRAVWAVYAFLPLFLVVGAVGAYFAFHASRALMSFATVFATIAAFAMCLGLMRWPSIHWALAEAYSNAGADARLTIAAVFDGLNLYLGNYIGEFLGETLLAAFFILTGYAMLSERMSLWLGWSGIAFGLLFFVGAFRNVTSSVQPIADINNGLLPLWMIVLGSSMIWPAKSMVAASIGINPH